jgi:hypothetical protein
VNQPSALQKCFPIKKKLVNIMPMLNRSRATKKVRRKCDGMPKDQMRSFCLARIFVASLKGSQKKKSRKATLAIYNTIIKVFINELKTPLPK